MITPFPVPTQRRFPPISSAVIRTKEKPSLPVPAGRVRGRTGQGGHLLLGSARVLPTALTQHLTDVRLDVHILEVLVRVGVVEPQGRVQPDGHPDAVADPRQLTHLALPARVGVEGLLQGGSSSSGSSLPRLRRTQRFG